MENDIRQIINAITNYKSFHKKDKKQTIYHSIYRVKEAQNLFNDNDDFYYRLFVTETNFIIIYEVLKKYELCNTYKDEIDQYLLSNIERKIDVFCELIEKIENTELGDFNKSLRIYEY